MEKEERVRREREEREVQSQGEGERGGGWGGGGGERCTLVCREREGGKYNNNYSLENSRNPVRVCVTIHYPGIPPAQISNRVLNYIHRNLIYLSLN